MGEGFGVGSVGSVGDGVEPVDGDGEGLGLGAGDGRAAGVPVGLGEPVAADEGVTVAADDSDAPEPLGVVLGAALDDAGADGAGDPEGATLAAPAAGVGRASGRIAAPMAIAASSDGSMATAMKIVERVRFMGVPP